MEEYLDDMIGDEDNDILLGTLTWRGIIVIFIFTKHPYWRDR